MKKTFRLILAWALMLTPFQSVRSQWGSPATLYLQREEQPDAGIYLPAPPDTSSVAFIDDFVQWQWGKTVRYTDRGERASQESLSGASVMARIFSEIIGFNISRSETPAMYKLLSNSYSTSEQCYKSAKEKYMRTRPFAQFGEHPTGRYDNESSMRTSGSYPSGHTSRGMAVSFVFAELIPEYQDTILRRGYEYGESRLMVAAHYQSDVNAGYMCASACVAMMHSVPEFLADFEAARAEYYEKSGRKPASTPANPDGRRILNEPVDTASARYLGDVALHMAAKAERNTERGQQAVKDADLSVEAVLSAFAGPMGMNMDTKSTPALANLVTESLRALTENASDLAKTSTFRKRPYVQLGEVSFAGGDNDRTSSFPSVGAEAGWGIALVLTEVAPTHSNEILSRGFQMGYSSVITGQNWATDIVAGRIMAAAMVARLHNSPVFRSLLEEAKKEYSGG